MEEEKKRYPTLRNGGKAATKQQSLQRRVALMIRTSCGRHYIQQAASGRMSHTHRVYDCN